MDDATIDFLRAEIERLQHKLEGLGSNEVSVPYFRMDLSREIPEWAGESNIEAYLERFELVAGQGAWTDLTRLNVFRLRLRGEAEQFARNHPELFTVTSTWEGTKEAFRSRFTRKKNEVVLLQALLACTKEPGESYRAFADRCLATGRDATVRFTSRRKQEGADEAMARVMFGVFLRGLAPELQNIIAASNENSIAGALEVVERVRQMEELRVGEKTTGHPEISRVKKTSIRSLNKQEEVKDDQLPGVEGGCYMERDNSDDEGQWIKVIRSGRRPQGKWKGTKERVGGPVAPRHQPTAYYGAAPSRTDRDKEDKVKFRRPLSPRKWKCRTCGGVGHLARQCPSTTCYRCGERGHICRNCPKENVTPSGERLEKSLGPNEKCSRNPPTWGTSRNREATWEY